MEQWTAQAANRDDLPEIGRFFKREFKGHGTYGTMEYFQWKIVDNVIAPGVMNLVRVPGGIASTTSLTPKSLFVRGARQAAAEIGDTYTDPGYQRQGMFSLLINQTRADGNRMGIEFIYGTPNDQSLPGYEKNANFKAMPGIQLQSLFFPVHVGRALQLRLPWAIAAATGFGWSLLVQAWIWLQAMLGRRSDCQVEEINELPADWDAFWDESRLQYDFLLSREARYLKWRYFDVPIRYHVLVARRGRKIIGYLVYRVVLDEKLPTLRIADYLSLVGEENVLRVLLNRALQAALQAGAVKVSAWCPLSNPHYPHFRSHGFQPDIQVPVICHQNETARKIQDECHSWHFSIGDSDNV